MISSFMLKFGRSPGAPVTTVDTTPITVFVGPNNSGKSKVLTELEQYCRMGYIAQNSLIVGSVNFSGLTEEAALAAIEQIKKPPNSNEALHADHIIVASRFGRFQLNRNEIMAAVLHPQNRADRFCQWFLTHRTMSLDGRSRFSLVSQQPAGDLHQPPAMSLQLLFRDDAKRSEVRGIVHDAFGMHFVIDPTNLGQLRIRLSPRAPENALEERGIHDEAVRFQSAAQLIDDASDGVKAFTGIITELVAGDPKVLFIDEPEAFLHPSLASKLGQEVSRIALATDKRVFVATHSPNFVMGCIQSGAPVNIVRLTYRNRVATARILPSNDILELMRNPLLRSTGVLQGLFYEFVVVTESDTDRAYYQEVNERLLRFKPEWGIPNCLFINAQNKQTIHTIIKPLRQLGIPAAAIVDIDVLKEGGTNWSNLLSGANLPELSRNSLATARAAVHNAMTATGRDMKRDGGLAILSQGEQEASRNLLTQLSDYGVFVVPGGGLESWTKSLGAAGKGPAWLVSVFEKMGDDPESVAYVKPTNNDVWEFISHVGSWLRDPSRRGIPD